MILLIDTADPDSTSFAIFSEKKVVRKTWNSKVKQSEAILPKLCQFLNSKKISWQQIKKLAVIAGPGPYSRVRTGIAMVNALALALNLKIVPVKKDAVVNFSKLNRQTGFGMVKPIYLS